MVYLPVGFSGLNVMHSPGSASSRRGLLSEGGGAVPRFVLEMFGTLLVCLARFEFFASFTFESFLGSNRLFCKAKYGPRTNGVLGGMGSCDPGNGM